MTEPKTKIMFTVTERTKADFKLQLQYDSLTQAKFFRSLMEGYVSKDPDLMVYINKFKKDLGIALPLLFLQSIRHWDYLMLYY